MNAFLISQVLSFVKLSFKIVAGTNFELHRFLYTIFKFASELDFRCSISFAKVLFRFSFLSKKF